MVCNILFKKLMASLQVTFCKKLLIFKYRHHQHQTEIGIKNK